MILGSPPDYDDPDEDSSEDSSLPDLGIKLTFMHCLGNEEPSWEENFINIFQPTALCISTVFMIIILIVYILHAKLRESLVGKITMGFLTNLILCYIVITDSFLKDNDKRRETTECILTGYAIIYFFHGYFLWLNSMAINIWLSFTNLSVARLKDRTKFLICLIYSQGLPLLLCAFTAIIDAGGIGQRAELLQSHPEVGKYNCYLGSMKTNQPQSYFKTPEFIYQQSVLILVQVSNLVFLVLTGLIIKSATVQNKRQAAREQFFSFVKIFFLLGFTWTAEVISTALAVEHGWEETFYVRLFLDLVNLFLGVLLFYALVCNKQVAQMTKAKILGRSLSNNYDPDEIKMSEMGET